MFDGLKSHDDLIQSLLETIEQRRSGPEHLALAASRQFEGDFFQGLKAQVGPWGDTLGWVDSDEVTITPAEGYPLEFAHHFMAVDGESFRVGVRTAAVVVAAQVARYLFSLRTPFRFRYIDVGTRIRAGTASQASIIPFAGTVLLTLGHTLADGESNDTQRH